MLKCHTVSLAILDNVACSLKTNSKSWMMEDITSLSLQSLLCLLMAWHCYVLGYLLAYRWLGLVQFMYTGLILGLCPANERHCYFVMMSLIGLGASLESVLYTGLAIQGLRLWISQNATFRLLNGVTWGDRATPWVLGHKIWFVRVRKWSLYQN